MIDTGMYRKNLRLEVVSTPKEEDKREHLARLLHEVEGTGIVYVSTVRDCEEVTDYLAARGFDVARYHGRLGVKERKTSQDRFLAGDMKAIIATNAFGMGIDKPDIRFVVHYNLPGSLESYYQEAGCAGRDGEPARCVLFYQAEDRNTQLFFLNGRYPKKEHFSAVYRALDRRKAAPGPVSAETLQERTAAAGNVANKSKVRVVLAAMKELGLVGEPEPGAFELLRAGLSEPELDELALSYEKRAEGDRERLKRMVHYAQTALCRWKALLDYFGEELEQESCGRCDNCGHPVRQPIAPRAEPPVQVPHAPPKAMPLPPILGDRDPASLQTGEILTLPIYGRGEITTVGDDSFVLVFADGETREFRRG